MNEEVPPPHPDWQHDKEGSGHRVDPTPNATPPVPTPAKRLRRFHGTVTLDSAQAGRDASRIAEEVIAHLTGQVGAEVTVTLEIDATIPDGASDQIVRTVTENSRVLKFSSHGFESE